MRKAEKGKIGYGEDSLGTEENNLSVREMRALETKPIAVQWHLPFPTILKYF